MLTEVVLQYAAFDKNIQKTVDRQTGNNMDKLRFYADTYATYYDNYIGMGAIMLHYEELLHLSETREIISECILKRNEFVCKLFENAIADKEIRAVFTPRELTLIFNGIFYGGTFGEENQIFRKDISC